MATWTQDDLESVEDAIRQLVAGAREVEVTLQDRHIRYSDVKLPELRELRSEITATVSATSSTGARQRIHRGIYSKGL